MCWRSFTNVKIFKYYKDLINFKNKGNPAQLLKSVNPGEAALLDTASNCHIRFRLGGEKFPPLIYYKIFTHGSLCDIGSFAPRDYQRMKREKGRDVIDVRHDKKFDLTGNTGWYDRFENNGWRPISDKILNPSSKVEVITSQKVKKFHYDVKMRVKAVYQNKRKRKLKWLKKLYKDAKEAEIE